MSTAKQDIRAKLNELSALSNELPDGQGKIAIRHLSNKLEVLLEHSLLDDGTTNLAAVNLIPQKGLVKDLMAEGDGHAVTCC